MSALQPGTAAATPEPTYGTKEPGYSARARADVLELLPDRPGNLLEIGSVTGSTSAAAKTLGKAAHVVAVDLVDPRPEHVGPHGIDRFVRGSAESLDFAGLGGPFDAILCADVLEHLVDPWTTVGRLRDALAPGGCIVASLPNFRNHRVLTQVVLRGSFRYEAAGILDETHLRFFCRQDVLRLFSSAGLEVEAVATNMGGYGLRNKVFVWASFGRLRDFFVFQYLVRARRRA